MKKMSLPSSSPLMRDSFLFGVATSSFQIEGDVENRLPCIWDTFCATPGKIADNSDGIIACEHVERWRDDFEILSDLGVDAYRFSISWPRVITADGDINEQGVNFYLEQLADLHNRGIDAWVTLYHWDLPQHLEDKGGWLNRDTVYEYEKYVRLISQRLKGKVAGWSTFNEPFCSAFLGYEVGVHAPGKTGRANGRQAAHHILLAHGLGMKVLRETDPKAKAGIVLNFTPCYAASDSDDDLAATDWAHQYINLWYINPLMEGRYPDVFNEIPDAEQPTVEAGDMAIINQRIDYLGINFYTRLTYSAPKESGELYFEHEHLEPRTAIGWEIYPNALYDILMDLHQRYDLPPVYITENGAAMSDILEGAEVKDDDRIEYYQAHLSALSDAALAGVDIQGYFAWSLMDNFEWAEGYSQRFGLVYVDFETQQRTLKNSGKAYKDLLSSRDKICVSDLESVASK